MKKTLLIFLLSAVSVFAQAGNTGLSFLKFGFGARNIAMGDLGVATANDVTALYYNPALISQYKNPQLQITHNQLIQDVSSEMIGAGFSLFGLPFALGVNTTSVKGIEVRTMPGVAESTFDAHYFSGGLSTGFNITEQLSFGLTAKYIYEGLFSDNANGMGFDFGANYSGLIENLNIGVSVRNLGSMNNLRNEATKLPVDIRAGAGYNFSASSINSDITLTAGYQKYNEVDENHFHFGGDIFYKQFLSLRAGYMTGYDSKSFTAGLGIVWGNFAFDYAYTPYDFDLGNSNIISVNYFFN